MNLNSRATALTIMVGSCFLAATGQAAVFRCVDADGTNTYSDKPCGPTSPPPNVSPSVHAASHDGAAAQDRTAGAPPPATAAERATAAKEAKASQILQMLRLSWVSGSDSVHAQRTVDLVAPDLVKQLDPANTAWNPQNPKWHFVLGFVKSDLRKDVQSVMRASAAQTAQATAGEYAAHAQDADMDAMIQYLNSPEGARYIAFQAELRPILSQAFESLMDQEPMPVQQPTDAALKHRQQLLSLGLEFRIATEGGGASLGSLGPGSPTLMENTAHREGTALDALYVGYEAYVPGFVAFTQSATAKHFFIASEPALRTSIALSSTAAADFAELEAAKYEQRWWAAYGPPVRGSTRVMVVVHPRTLTVSTTSRVIYNGVQSSAEAMAIQCEQREDAAYARTHRPTSDYNAQAAALNAIQRDCRAEQNLPPL